MRTGWISILIGLFSLILSPGTGYSQGKIGGQILSGEEPLVGASVAIKNTLIGGFSDAEGLFFLEEVPVGEQILIISYVGYSTVEIKTTIVEGETIMLGQISMEIGESLEEVVIQGKMAEGEKKAFKMMFGSKRVTQIKSAESIADLPDKNAAEALQRMPGVVMEADHGEGQYISFRGTPTDWSTVTINGDRMPVANEEILGRALNLDVLPTSLIDYIEYNQTLTPNIEADAIGGNANFITRLVPDDPTLDVSISAGYNAKAQKPIYNASILGGGRSKNKKIGFVGGASFFNRNWSTDNYEIFYGSNESHSLSRMELRKYNGRRNTYGAHLKVDFKPNPNHEIFILGFGGLMRDDEFNRKTMYNWSTGVGQSIRLQNIHNVLEHQILGASLGANHKIGGRLNFHWEVSSYESKFGYGNIPFQDRNDPRNGYYVVEYEKVVEFTDFLYLDENGKQVTINDDYDQRFKYLNIDSPIDGYGDSFENIRPTYMVNPNPFRETDTMFIFTKAYTETNSNDERDPIVAKIDLDYEVSPDLRLSIGGKYRYKEGTRRIGLEAWQRNPFVPTILTYNDLELEEIPNREDFLSETGNNYSELTEQFIEENQLANFLFDFEEDLAYLPFNENTPFYPQFVGSSFNYTEDAIAGYVMADWDFDDKFNVTGGVRFEHTDAFVTADTLIRTFTSTGILEELLPIPVEKSYPAILPMIAITWEFAPSSKILFASTRSYRRVNFNEIKPGEPEIHYTHFHLLGGNPNLEPTYSWNNDLSIQKYFGLEGFASLTLYYKQIKDHIYTSFLSTALEGNTTAGQFSIPGGIVAKRYENAPSAEVMGFEIAFEKRFSNSKTPVIKNLGIGTNYSWTESSMEIPSREEAQPMTRQAKHVLNARLSFTNKKFETNIGLNYRSPYLLELNLFSFIDPNTGQQVVRQSNDFDVFMGRSLTLDASANLKISAHLTLTLELLNLLNTEYVEYRGVRERPIKTEYYGIRGLAGIRYSLGGGKEKGQFRSNMETHNHSH